MSNSLFKIAQPILIEDFKKIESRIDWNEYYVRFGTEKLIYYDEYRDVVPNHLVGKVTHVWIYIQP